jgi:lipoprotein-releasing system permease protein
MSYSAFIAERYFRSARRRGFLSFISSIAIVGVALGAAALIIALSVLGGFEQELTEKVIGFTSHVQVTSFRSAPLPNYLSNTSRIEECSPLVKAVQPFVAREALIRFKENVDGVFLKGVDPTRDVSSVAKYIVAGKYDITRTAGGLANLVIGKKLADRLEISLDDKVTIFGTGNAAERQMRVMQFKVVGMYESGMSEYDDVFAFTSLKDAQILFQFGESVSGYDINITKLDSVDSVADKIREALGFPHYPRTVFQNYRSLFSWIELQKKPVPIILGLIIIVATVNIIGTLLMVVLGKTKEIGILKSLGAKRGGITSIFVRQGLWIGFVGTALGNLLAFTLCFAEQKLRFLSLPSDIYFMSSVPILVEPKFYIIVSLISIALCYCCSLLPAWLASRIDPIRSIRFV